MSDRRGLLINPRGCHARQLLVSGFFLGECFLEKANDLIMAHGQRPRDDGSISGNFIVLGPLGGGDQRSIHRGFVEILGHDLFAFVEYARDAFTFSFARAFTQGAEDLFEPLDVLHRFTMMTVESVRQWRRGRCSCQFRQRVGQLLFSVVEMAQFVQKQVVNVEGARAFEVGDSTPALRRRDTRAKLGRFLLRVGDGSSCSSARSCRVRTGTRTRRKPSTMDDANQLFWVVVVISGAIALWRILQLFVELFGTLGQLLGEDKADEEHVERMLDRFDENSKTRR